MSYEIIPIQRKGDFIIRPASTSLLIKVTVNDAEDGQQAILALTCIEAARVAAGLLRVAIDIAETEHRKDQPNETPL